MEFIYYIHFTFLGFRTANCAYKAIGRPNCVTCPIYFCIHKFNIYCPIYENREYIINVFHGIQNNLKKM